MTIKGEDKRGAKITQEQRDENIVMKNGNKYMKASIIFSII